MRLLFVREAKGRRPEPRLEILAGRIFRRCNPLNCFASSATTGNGGMLLRIITAVTDEGSWHTFCHNSLLTEELCGLDVKGLLQLMSLFKQSVTTSIPNGTPMISPNQWMYLLDSCDPSLAPRCRRTCVILGRAELVLVLTTNGWRLLTIPAEGRRDGPSL